MNFRRDNFTSAKVRSFVPEITFNLNEGQPIHLFFYDQASQSFEINADAMQLLLEYEGNIGFIVNIGQRGVGKSYLLNQVMDLEANSNRFRERERGVKIWTRPLFREEEFVHLFFVDVQGFENDWNFRHFIWSFSFLLGTLVLYSTHGPITEKSFEELDSFAYLSQNIVFSDDEVENEYLMSYYAPKLIWLLKDFEEIDENGKPSPPDKYLESMLRDANRNQLQNQAVSYTKNFIINTFKDPCCINFPPSSVPIQFNDHLQSMEPEYIDGVRLLKERIYSKALNKFFDGITLTSRMVVNFIACIVELHNQKSPVVYSKMQVKKLRVNAPPGMRGSLQYFH
jgi:hypothetical protein